MGHLILVLLFLSKMNTAALFDVENINKPKQDKAEKEVVSEEIKKEETKTNVEQIKEKNPYTIGKNNWQINLNILIEIVELKESFGANLSDGLGIVSPYTTYHPLSTGLSISYGLNNEIHFSFGMPVLNEFVIKKLNVWENDINYDYTYLNRTFTGSPYFSAVYSKNIYQYSEKKHPLYFTIYPYLMTPWFSSNKLTTTTEWHDEYFDFHSETKKENINWIGEEPFQFGLTTIIATNFYSIIGELYLNIHKNFGSDYAKENTFLNYAVYLGYKFKDNSVIKLGINKDIRTYNFYQKNEFIKTEIIYSRLDSINLFDYKIPGKLSNEFIISAGKEFLCFGYKIGYLF